MARTSNLSDFLTDVSQAIKDKKGDQTPILASNFDTEITNLPSGGVAVTENDVIFINHEGELLYSYSEQEFLSLTEMPEVPAKAGLTPIGWNWSLEGAQNYVREVHGQIIGAIYTTDDGSTRVYLEIPKNNTTVASSLIVDGTITVDWGDGSPLEEYTGVVSGAYNEVANTNISHIYSNEGSYIYKITPTETTWFTTGKYSNTSPGGCSYLIHDNTGTVFHKHTYNAEFITKIEFGRNVMHYKDMLNYLPNLRYILMPIINWDKTISEKRTDYSLISLYSLKAFVTTNYFVLPRDDNMGSMDYGSMQYTSKIKYISIGEELSLNRMTYPTRDDVTLGQSKRIFFHDKLPGSIYCPNIEYIGVKNPDNASPFTIKTYNTGIIFKHPELDNVGLTRFSIYGNSNSVSSLLEEIYIPEGVTTVNYIQSKCVRVTHFPSTLLSLPISGAFSSTGYTEKIDDFSKAKQVPTINATAFDWSGKHTFIVPDELYDDWIVAENWSNMASQIIKASEYYGS